MSEKSLGILLFTTTMIAVTARSVLNHNAKNLRGLDKGNVVDKQSSDSGYGDFIVANSAGFLSGAWRTKVSSKTPAASSIASECELTVINDTNETVLLCWVTDTGNLRNVRPVNDASIKDGSVKNHHNEFTYTNDCFVCIKRTEKVPKSLSDVESENFIFSYTPLRALHKHYITLKKQPTKKRRIVDLLPFISSTAKAITATLEVKPCSDDDKEVISTVDKKYDHKNICGFDILYEPDVFTCLPDLESTLCSDLSQIVSMLSPEVCTQLQSGTPIWINKSITYGTIGKPVVGASCTFHPKGGGEWLRRNGLAVQKEGSVEIFSASNYLKSRTLWGVGGVLLHEFSHAYHNKHCTDGFNCEEVKQAYNVAMLKKLYDAVPVHGVQGQKGTAKAYACANCMEFFAELSVAYHWTADDNTEYNKWFPYNRAMLEKHDPDTFKVLQRCWSPSSPASIIAA